MAQTLDVDPRRTLTFEIPNLDGKVAIVTGGNRGMGFQITQQLANHGAKVYLACRSAESAKKAIETIEAQNSALSGKNRIIHLPFDLSTLKGSQQSAREFLKQDNRLDILVHNAAVLAHSYALTSEGLEDSFAINHLGVFVFTKELLPLLLSTANQPGSDVRVVTVSSDVHPIAPSGGRFLTVDEINQPLVWNFLSDYLPGRYFRYARSKLANALFAKQLQKVFQDASSPILSIAVNPGAVSTETVLENFGSVPLIGGLIRAILLKYGLSPLQGAATPLFAAVAPEVRENAEKYAGAYLTVNGEFGKPSKDAQSAELAEKLWKVSEEISDGILSRA